MSLTTLLVPTYKQMLKGLSAWLEKAHKQLSDTESELLLSAKLAPDMLPLSSQVSFACYQAQESSYRLKGIPIPDGLKQLTIEGQKAEDCPGSIANAQAKITGALAFLENLEVNELDDYASQTVTLNLSADMVFDMTGEQYVRDWALAQFYFHITTAYAILRNQKIDLGKADYVPYMFSYLRHDTQSETEKK